MAVVFDHPKSLLDVSTHFCPGCGHGIVHRLVCEVIDEMGIEGDTIGVVPVGCSVMSYNYFGCDVIEAPHGRAPAVATGAKRTNPDKFVFSYQGDGDLAAIGTAETVHVGTRGENIVVIFINNTTYGMTGGQFSPTTPTGDFATTAPYGSIDPDFDIPRLAEAAGATYTARGTAYHVPQTVKLIENAIAHEGFSLVECVSVCPTYYGRKNKKGDAVEMLKWQRDNAVPVSKARSMSAEELKGKIVYGELSRCERPEYTKEYDKIIAAAGGAKA